MPTGHCPASLTRCFEFTQINRRGKVIKTETAAPHSQRFPRKDVCDGNSGRQSWASESGRRSRQIPTLLPTALLSEAPEAPGPNGCFTVCSGSCGGSGTCLCVSVLHQRTWVTVCCSLENSRGSRSVHKPALCQHFPSSKPTLCSSLPLVFPVEGGANGSGPLSVPW